jgi:hypothetical protein
MKYILNFDDEINAGLIAKTVIRAGGGSLNKALQTMIIEWNALEDAGNRLETDRKPTKVQEDSQSEDQLIDAAWDAIGNK